MIFTLKYVRPASKETGRKTLESFAEAIDAAMDAAIEGHPADIYRNHTLLATVWVDGGIDFTPDARTYR